LGLETSESLMNEFPHFMIDSDKIKKLGIRMFMRDTLPTTLPQGSYILNLDKSTGGGTHFTCFCFKFPNVYYVDSFGTDKSGYPPEELRQFARRNDYLTIYSNEDDVQHLNSWLCGWYAIYFCQKMKKYYNQLTPQTFDTIIHKGFTKYPSDSNVELLKQWASKKGIGFD